MLNAVGLGVLFTAKDEASEVAEKLKKAFEGVHHQAEHAHAGVAQAFAGITKIAIGTGVALAGVGVALGFEFAEHAEHFSGALNKARVAAHATNEEFEDLERVAKQRSLDSMSGSAITVAESLQQLAIEGFNTEESAQALNGTLNLLKISMGAMDPKGAAGLVHDTIKEFGMEANESGELVDKLAFAMQHFGFRAEELQGTMTGLASGAHLTGSSLDDVLVGVGLVHQIFPSATKSAMAMNVAMNQLADTHHQQLIAQTLGIQVVDQHTKKLRPLVDIMRDLSVRTAKMSESQLSHTLETIAGGRAAGGLSAIIDGLRKGVVDTSGKLLTGAAALDFYRNELNQSGGAAKKMGDMLNNDLGGAISSLKKAISNAGVLFGGQFEESFTHAVQAANLAVRGLTQLFSQGGFSGEVMEEMDKAGNGGIKNFAIQTFLWIKRIQNFFSGLVDSFKEEFKQWQPFVDALVVSFGALGQALGITSQSANDNASKFDAFGSAGNNVGTILAGLVGTLAGALNGAIILATASVAAFKYQWDLIGPTVTSAFQIIKGAFEVINAVLSGDWEKLWDGMVDIVFGALKLVIRTFAGAMGIIAKGLDVLTLGNFNYSARVDAETKTSMASLDRGEAYLKNPGGNITMSPALAAQQATAAAFKRYDNGQGDEPPAFLIPNTHVHLHVDSEKVAEAVVKGKRSNDARSFGGVDDKGGS